MQYYRPLKFFFVNKVSLPAKQSFRRLAERLNIFLTSESVRVKGHGMALRQIMLIQVYTNENHS